MDSFKLLGVTIDNRLNFSEYVHIVKTDIYKKLFYLSKSVKVQFFKSFIMPHFNYCMSIVIYFPKSSIQTLANCFYYCLYKLFKFKVSSVPMETNNNLEKLGLSTFQNFIILKLCSFIHKIYHEVNSPKNLKAQIIQTKDVISYNLRSNKKFNQTQTKLSHYGESTFNYFTSKFLNEFIGDDVECNINLFKNRILNNINILFNKFIRLFPKFDIVFKNFDYLEKNSNHICV